MPITADELSKLCALGEQSNTDYKTSDFDWSGDKKSANAELAKDIMAMANILAVAGDRFGYILIGCEDDGTIVGMSSPHQDDAALHQKVDKHLNNVPSFVYAAVEIDSKSVGVYQIQAGGRPYASKAGKESEHANEDLCISTDAVTRQNVARSLFSAAPIFSRESVNRPGFTGAVNHQSYASTRDLS